MLSRRTFFQSPAALAAPPPRFFGYWGMEAEQLVKATGNRYHLAACETHDGPVVQAPDGLPAFGTPVIVHITADLCLRRGMGEHRQRTRWVIRVKPLRGGEAELREEQKSHIALTNVRPAHDACFRVGEEWWFARHVEKPPEKYGDGLPLGNSAPPWIIEEEA